MLGASGCRAGRSICWATLHERAGGGYLGGFGQLAGDFEGYAHGLDLALRQPPQRQTGTKGNDTGFKPLK
jgi:hypothetical protein